MQHLNLFLEGLIKSKGLSKPKVKYVLTPCIGSHSLSIYIESQRQKDHTNKIYKLVI